MSTRQTLKTKYVADREYWFGDFQNGYGTGKVVKIEPLYEKDGMIHFIEDLGFCYARQLRKSDQRLYRSEAAARAYVREQAQKFYDKAQQALQRAALELARWSEPTEGKQQ